MPHNNSSCSARGGSRVRSSKSQVPDIKAVKKQQELATKEPTAHQLKLQAKADAKQERTKARKESDQYVANRAFSDWMKGERASPYVYVQDEHGFTQRLEVFRKINYDSRDPPINVRTVTRGYFEGCSDVCFREN